jgi:hypothetical protein
MKKGIDKMNKSGLHIFTKLSKDIFDFKFKQYEGLYFHGDVLEDSKTVKYKVTSDVEGEDLKEFGVTHIKDNMVHIPFIDAYIDLDSVDKK